LLANAVSQTTNTLRQNPIRGQARSYCYSAQSRQPSAYAKSIDPGSTRNLPRTRICRSRLAGERGEPDDKCAAAKSPSRASALLQLLSAVPAAFGVREIRESGQHRQPLAYAKSIDPGSTRNLQRTQIGRSRLAGERGEPDNKCVAAKSHSRASALLQLIRAIPTAFGVRKISWSGQHRQPSACAKSADPGNPQPPTYSALLRLSSEASPVHP
jgi:hypothetical protein